MVYVEFLGPIKKDKIAIEASNLKDVALELRKDDEVASWLENSAVAVNDTLVKSMDIALKDGDKISLLPPVCGGWVMAIQSLELYDGALDVDAILSKWYKEEAKSNYGAYLPFIGTVRSEDEIEGLSFDIYEPILESWFTSWQEKAKERGAIVKMAHSKGDVLVHESSYIAAVFSPKRRVALEMIDEFVEDFKASAPIWKYDLLDGKRVYAEDRSTAIDGAGLLSEGEK